VLYMMRPFDDRSIKVLGRGASECPSKLTR
jgi:hypothetical protein